jgi:uncharacterized protein (TIGR03086 family)
MTDTNSEASQVAPDTRSGLFRAISLAGETIVGVTPADLESGTPCPDYNVRQLVRHMIAVLHRLPVAVSGGNPFSLPSLANDVPDTHQIAAWNDAASAAKTAWSAPDALERMCNLGFVTLPGIAAAVTYTTEITLHTWDLARATGQRPTWDPAVLAPSLGAMRHAVPAEPRGGMVPFGPVVTVGADAPPINQLVGWYGRQP